jgi:hypothetical protein
MNYKETLDYVESEMNRWPTLIGAHGCETRPFLASRREIVFPSFPKADALREAKAEKTRVQTILASDAFKGLDTGFLWNKVDEAAFKLYMEENAWTALCQVTWRDVPIFTALLKKALQEEIDAGGAEAIRIQKEKEAHDKYLAERQAMEARNASRLQWWVAKARRCKARGEEDYVIFLVQQAKKAGIERVRYIQEQINGKA